MSKATVTYGDVLMQHACKTRGYADPWREAINELAACWLENGRWHRECENVNAVRKSIQNKQRDLHRARRDQQPGHAHALDPPSAGRGDEARLMARDQLRRIGRALSIGDVKVLCLDFEGCKGPELAARLGLSHVAVRARLSRARERLVVLGLVS